DALRLRRGQTVRAMLPTRKQEGVWGNPRGVLPTRYLAVAFALLVLAAPALARDKVKITGAAVGFPAAGREDGVAKFATWAPVYVSLEILDTVTEPAELLIEAPDADEIGTTLARPIDLTGAAPGTKVFAPDRGALGYVRPANAAGEVTITVRA